MRAAPSPTSTTCTGNSAPRTWVGIPGLTPYQTCVESYQDGRKRTEHYLSASGALVNGAVGYAQASIDRDEAGEMLRVIYLDAAGKPAYCDRGYAGAEMVSKVPKYYDTAGHEMPNIEHGSVRPLLYITFLRSADCVAAKAGIQPGDILWQTGDVFYPTLLDGIWEKQDDFDTVRDELFAAWKAALASPTPVRVSVIRGGNLVELSYPSLPPGGIGIRFGVRRVPNQDYDELVARFGKPQPAASHVATTP